MESICTVNPRSFHPSFHILHAYADSFHNRDFHGLLPFHLAIRTYIQKYWLERHVLVAVLFIGTSKSSFYVHIIFHSVTNQIRTLHDTHLSCQAESTTDGSEPNYIFEQFLDTVMQWEDYVYLVFNPGCSFHRLWRVLLLGSVSVMGMHLVGFWYSIYFIPWECNCCGTCNIFYSYFTTAA